MMIRVLLGVVLALFLAGQPAAALAADDQVNGWTPVWTNTDAYTPDFPSMDLPYFNNLGGWDQAKQYMTIRVGDVDSDGMTDLVARSSRGIELWRWDLKKYGYWVPTLVPVRGTCVMDESEWEQPANYANILLADIDGDGAKELVGRSPTGLVAYKYQSNTAAWLTMPDGPAWSDSQWSDPSCYTTVQTARLDGSLTEYVVGRCENGLRAARFDDASGQWQSLAVNTAVSNDAGFDAPRYYETLRFADVDGDGADEMLIRRTHGFMTMGWDADSGQWKTMALDSPALDDNDGWNQPQYYQNVFTGDVDGDGTQELLVRAAGGVLCYAWNGKGFELQSTLYGFSDDGGWSDPLYYSTIRVGDIDGDGRAEVLGRHSTDGIVVYHQDGGQWTMLKASLPLTDAKGWNQPEYYQTLLLAPALADPRGKQQLMIRSQGGMRTYDYTATSSKGGTWDLAAGRYPDYAHGTPDQIAAFKAVMAALSVADLIPDGTTDMRYLYTDLSYDWGNFDSTINSTGTPTGVPDAVMRTVKTQLVKEVNDLANAWAMLQGAQGLKDYFTKKAMSDWQAEIEDARTLVKHTSDNDWGKFLLGMAMDDALELCTVLMPEEAVAERVGKFTVEKILAGLFKSGDHVIDSADDSDAEVDVAAADISQSLVNFKNSALGRLDAFHRDAAACPAKIHLLSELRLNKNFDYVTLFDKINGRVDWIWKTNVYKMLMPLAYNMFVWIHCYQRQTPDNNYYQLAETTQVISTYNIYAVHRPTGAKPSEELMDDIWDSDACNVSRQDFFKNQNGWHFTVVHEPACN